LKNKQLYQPLELYISENEEWQESALVYHFFEIVQILEGRGERIVNENNYSYKKGDIFLFTPMDCRGFKSLEPTKFCSIRFSEAFYTGKGSGHTNMIEWLKQLEQIFYHHNRFECVIIRSAADGQLISNLISNSIIESGQKGLYSEQNIQHYVTLILNILSRNIVTTPNHRVPHTEEPLINKILTYIKRNIGNSELLKTKNLSQQFNLSQNYVGEYFKNLTGENLQQYVSLYRMKCVKQRLLYSDYTITQIADELGFTDESHLSRQFKKHAGISPTKFRLENRGI